MRARGFTLIELLAVLAILGVLSTMALPVARIAAERSHERDLKRALWEIREAIDAYHAARVAGQIGADVGVDPAAAAYPSSLASLAQVHADIRPEHRGESFRFLRQIPRDPFAEASLPPESSWGLRSYLSEADKPTPGADVYDVHSLATGVALDGTPLATW